LPKNYDKIIKHKNSKYRVRGRVRVRVRAKLHTTKQLQNKINRRHDNSKMLINLVKGPRDNLSEKEKVANLLFSGPILNSNEVESIKKFSDNKPNFEKFRLELTTLDSSNSSENIHNTIEEVNKYDKKLGRRCSKSGMKHSTIMSEYRRKEIMNALMRPTLSDNNNNNNNKSITNNKEVLINEKRDKSKKKLSIFFENYYPKESMEFDESSLIEEPIDMTRAEKRAFDNKLREIKLKKELEAKLLIEEKSFAALNSETTSEIDQEEIKKEKLINNVPISPIKKSSHDCFPITGPYVPSPKFTANWDSYDTMRSRWSYLAPQVRSLKGENEIFAPTKPGSTFTVSDGTVISGSYGDVVYFEHHKAKIEENSMKLKLWKSQASSQIDAISSLEDNTSSISNFSI
jgi:hypothetical protein